MNEAYNGGEYDEEPQYAERPNKTQLKREMVELQELGEQLNMVSISELEKIISEKVLLDAVKQAKKIDSHSAAKRQKKFVGKLLSKLAEEQLGLIQEFIKQRFEQKNNSKQHFHELEAWRDKILTNGDNAINQLIEKYPQIERNFLRQLFRNATKEQQLQQAPKSARLIFKYLKESIPTQHG